MIDYKELIVRITKCRANCEIPRDLCTCNDAISAIETLLAERDAAINLLRQINWCCGCVHFNGLKGCGDNAMDVCCKENDHYKFCIPQVKVDTPHG